MTCVSLFSHCDAAGATNAHSTTMARRLNLQSHTADVRLCASFSELIVSLGERKNKDFGWSGSNAPFMDDAIESVKKL